MRLTTKCGIPLYAAAFYNSDILIVAGGGGQGAHGVPNKVLAYRAASASASLEAVAEYELPPNSDCPSSLAIGADRVIWVAVNTLDPETGKISQLLSLKLDEDAGQLRCLRTHALFSADSFSVYPKTVEARGDFVGCASSDALGSVVLLPSASTSSPKSTAKSTNSEPIRMSFDAELVDLAISSANERQPQLVAGVMDGEIEFRSVSQPNVRYVPPIPAPKGGRWSRIVSMYPQKFVAAATLGAKAGAQLSVIEIHGFGEAQISHTVLVPNLRGVTSLATNGSRIVAASADGSLVVYNALITEPTLIAQLRNVHTLPVTALALHADGNSVVSTSMDGSLVLNDQLDTVVSLKATLGWAVLSAVLIMLVGLLITLATFPQLQSTSIGAGLLEIKSMYEEALGYKLAATSFVPNGKIAEESSQGSTWEQSWEPEEPLEPLEPLEPMEPEESMESLEEQSWEPTEPLEELTEEHIEQQSWEQTEEQDYPEHHEPTEHKEL